ncbi:phosphonate metabolism transcriptional regulator PhnF [Cypionkella sinensis]|uniref:Phosphonate metabolism transcriptional regulator PhnF n=1 Tax=Cypionkella sinensis TaxID=1756043 RepID=A0ABV7J3B4_9RHOB
MARPAIWRSIADTLTAEIAWGHYPPGDKLPTEAALAARFGVNRHTVRQALAHLAEAGAVHPRRGAGVFVTAVPTDYPLGRRVRFHQNVLASGRTPSREILRLETRPADPDEATALQLETGALVHLVEGLSLADGTPLAMFRSVFPAARCPHLLLAMTRLGSVTAALAEAGVADYTRAETRITALAADALLALHLRLPQGAPLLRSVAVNVDPFGQPIEFGTTWFAGDRVTLTVMPETGDPARGVDKLS